MAKRKPQNKRPILKADCCDYSNGSYLMPVVCGNCGKYRATAKIPRGCEAVRWLMHVECPHCDCDSLEIDHGKA